MKYTTPRLNALHTLLYFMLGRKPSHGEMVDMHKIVLGKVKL